MTKSGRAYERWVDGLHDERDAALAAEWDDHVMRTLRWLEEHGHPQPPPQPCPTNEEEA
jgi:hypothetical protein